MAVRLFRLKNVIGGNPVIIRKFDRRFGRNISVAAIVSEIPRLRHVRHFDDSVLSQTTKSFELKCFPFYAKIYKNNGGEKGDIQRDRKTGDPGFQADRF